MEKPEGKGSSALECRESTAQRHGAFVVIFGHYSG